MRKFLIYSQKKVFLIFQENRTVIIQKMEFFSPKVKQFQDRTFEARKTTTKTNNKHSAKFLKFWEWNFLAPEKLIKLF